MKSIPLIALLVCMLACKSKPTVPSDILNQERMSKAMSYLLIAEEITYNQGFPIDSSKKIFLGNYKPILLDSLNISVEEYDKSLNFYLENPILFEKLMESTVLVLDTLVKAHQVP